MLLKYVNDTFILIDNTINLPCILNIINCIDHTFNSVLKLNNKITFLDVLVKTFKSHFQTFLFTQKLCHAN